MTTTHTGMAEDGGCDDVIHGESVGADAPPRATVRSYRTWFAKCPSCQWYGPHRLSDADASVDAASHNDVRADEHGNIHPPTWCRSCGANIPPRDGEGTCEVCAA